MHSPELFHGVFVWHAGGGRPHLSRPESRPAALPCPTTGRPLRISTIDANVDAICPACAQPGRGGFVSFEGDVRMAYACPECRQLVWTVGL
jgi:hypothetical protein